MIKIINTRGLVLELDPDTALTVERNNSLFNESDSFIQDISYSSKAGLTPNNKIFIEGGHLVSAENSVYEFQVHVEVLDEPFYGGAFSYKISQDKIQFTLKLNFASIANVIKSAKINEIFTGDAIQDIGNPENLASYMKQTCINPLNYPHVYLPVRNIGWPQNVTPYLNMNSWNIENQKFEVVYRVQTGTQTTIQVPFYRLSYIFSVVFKALGFESKGGFFDDDYGKNLYLYTRYGTISTYQYNCRYYLPEMTIADFLKQTARRLNISFDFDVLEKTVNIECFASIQIQNQYNDITEYVTKIKELDPVDKKGYTLTLKPDETDEQWSNGKDPKLFIPTAIMTIGTGETKDDLAISTLKEENSNLGYNYLLSNQRFYYSNKRIDLETWPLRLIEYKGMKSLPSGKLYPEGRAVELSRRDADWYRFLNDSKRVTIEAAIPPATLSKMKPSQKIKLKDRDGALFYALPEKISYTLSNKATNLVNVKILARSILANYSTTYSINPYIDPEDESLTMIQYKAYFDPMVHGISELEMKFVDPVHGGTFETMAKVQQPTDKYGLGGDIGRVRFVTGTGASVQDGEIRVYNLSPRYAIVGGIKFDFLPAAGYAYISGAGNHLFRDRTPFWIVF